MRNLLIFLLLSVVVVLSAGCFENVKEPKVYFEGVEIKNINEKNTNIVFKIVIDNPNSISITLKKISFDIYALNNGNKIFLGHGEKSNVEITSGNNTIEIPITLSTDKLINIIKEGSNTIPVEVDGNISIDLKITTISIPIKYQTDIKITDEIKEAIKEIILNKYKETVE
ncbi:LEA type 2 family protein [Methanocaldococcus indicus]|uniref:LEA type 2 family protein n=1 Tax=Methanocaldococcus indicus TaxID=213231 RepID=UPI003C6D082A